MGDVEYALEILKAHISRIVDLPDSEWHVAMRCFRRCAFERGEYLARAEDVLDRSFYVVRGLVRLFYTTRDGREHNKGFVSDGRIVGSAASRLLGAPAGFSMQALEATVTLAMADRDAERLLDRHVVWERLRRMAMERLFLEKEQREMEFLLCDAETRYRRFLARDPALAARIPLHHIASYLGMTPVALSRIRRRLRDSALGPVPDRRRLNPG